MNYSDLIVAIGVYLQQEQPDASFTAATPTFLALAEQRITREMGLLAVDGTNTSLSTSIGGKVLDLAAMTGQTIADGTPVAYAWPVVLETIAAKVGNRWIPFQLVSMDYLEMAWPDELLTAAPAVGFALYCMSDTTTVYLAPPPNAIYPLRITGQWRPAGLSLANPTTWISTYLPDLLVAAVVLEAMLYQRDNGDPQGPQGVVIWESRYQTAMRSAKVEEALKKGQGPGFQPYAPTPLANPAPTAAGPAPGG